MSCIKFKGDLNVSVNEEEYEKIRQYRMTAQETEIRISQILNRQAGFDPRNIPGTKLAEIGRNYLNDKDAREQDRKYQEFLQTQVENLRYGNKEVLPGVS